MKSSQEQAKHISNVIFDLDGTLVDSIPGIQASLLKAFNSIGKDFSEKDLRSSIGPPIGVIALRLDSALTPAQISAVERHYRLDYDSDGWMNSLLFDDVESTLDALRSSGFRLFVITNKPLIPTRHILEHFGLCDMFDEVLTRDSREPRYVSKSEMVADLVNRQLLAPSTCCFVGDTPEDEEAARANNMRFVFAEYGYGSMTDLPCSVSALRDLLQILGVPHENS